MGNQPHGLTWQRVLRGIALTVLSYLSTWAIHCYHGVPSNHVTLWLAVLGMVAFAQWHGMRVTDRRIRWASAGMAALFAFWLVLGREITTYFGLSKLGALDALWERFCMMLGFAALFYALLALVLRRLLTGDGWGRASDKVYYHLGEGKGGFWLLTALFFVCWLPYFLAGFPGLMTEDSFMQLSQAAGREPWVNAHPVIHTAMVALCWRVGGQTAGVAIYSVAQMLLLAACCAYAMRALARWRAHPAVWWGVWAFFAASPIQAVYSFFMWKDVLFAGYMLVLVVMLFDLAADPQAVLSSWPRKIWLGVMLFLCCTWRTNGVLAVALFVPVLIIAMRRHWKPVCAMVGAVALCLVCYHGPLFAALGIRSGPATEALSIPLQQVARTMRDHGGEISAQDRLIIGEILPVDKLATLYHPRIADYVKERIDGAAFNKAPGRYAALWARLGVRFPESYLVAFLCNNYGYWYPDTEQWVVTTGEILPDNAFGLANHPVWPLFYDMEEQIDRNARATQGLRVFYSIAIMVWLDIFCAAVVVLKRRKELLLPLALLCCLWLTVLFAPLAAEYRYAYPLTLSAPVCLGVALAARRRDTKDKEAV